MEKDFYSWSIKKEFFHKNRKKLFCHPREIWWCALGINIGAEIDGKNENFERPVLVMRVYNKETLLILPITSSAKDDNFHQALTSKIGKVWAKLTQTRVISSNRLLRKIDLISQEEFGKVKESFQRFI